MCCVLSHVQSNIRTPGAFLVSASRSQYGKISQIRILSEVGGICKLARLGKITIMRADGASVPVACNSPGNYCAFKTAANTTYNVSVEKRVGDPAGDLQQKVDNAIVNCKQKQQCELIVPKADYDFGNRTFSIHDAKGLSIRSDGATLWFAGFSSGVFLKQCEDVAFAGFTVDRKPPPYIQATVSSNSNGDLEYFVPEPFPTKLPSGWMFGGPKQGVHGNLFAPDDLWNRKCGVNFDFAKVSSLGNRHFKLKDSGCPQAKRGDVLSAYLWGGFSYTIANSTRVLTEDVTIRATGWLVFGEFDGVGNNTYRRVRAEAAPGRPMASNADGIHSADVEIGPTIDSCYLSRLYDDYFNVHNTFQMVMNISGSALTLVHPHTGPTIVPLEGHTDQFYGTTEPLRRVRVGDNLLFYDPITFDFLGRVAVRSAPRQMEAPANSTLGRQADGLWDVINAKPYNFPGFTPQKYTLQNYRSSVYEVELSAPPPHTTTEHLLVPYVVEIEKNRCRGATVMNSVFEYSTGFFGRWKSSASRIINNTFHHVHTEELELHFLPSFFEGPLTIEDVLIANNTFFVHGNAKKASDIVNFDSKFVHGLVLRDNLVFHESTTAQTLAQVQTSNIEPSTYNVSVEASRLKE
eukprot:SAG31_NODE_1227_length_9239_cov_29.041904_5_plen_632_part_00